MRTHSRRRLPVSPSSVAAGFRVLSQCKPLSREQVVDFSRALEQYGGYRTTVIALRLMLLTFVRTVELRKVE